MGIEPDADVPRTAAGRALRRDVWRAV